MPPQTQHDPDTTPPPDAVLLKGRVARWRAKAGRTNHVREIIETLVVAAIVFLVVHSSAQIYRVDGQSMQPGLHDANYVLVSPILYAFGGSPQRGDVIVFHSPLDPNKQLIKRVIAIPGDTFSISSSGVVVDGKQLSEPYISGQGGSVPFECGQNFSNITLGAEDYLVLGDNRGNSLDSRCFGSVPRRNIVGKAIALILPLNQIHWLNTYAGVFAGVKK